MVMTFPEKGLNIHLYSFLPLQNSQITLLKQTKQSDITEADRARTKMFFKNKISIEALRTKALKSRTFRMSSRRPNPCVTLLNTYNNTQ